MELVMPVVFKYTESARPKFVSGKFFLQQLITG